MKIYKCEICINYSNRIENVIFATKQGNLKGGELMRMIKGQFVEKIERRHKNKTIVGIFIKYV